MCIFTENPVKNILEIQKVICFCWRNILNWDSILCKKHTLFLFVFILVFVWSTSNLVPKWEGFSLCCNGTIKRLTRSSRSKVEHGWPWSRWVARPTELIVGDGEFPARGPWQRTQEIKLCNVYTTMHSWLLQKKKDQLKQFSTQKLWRKK